MYSEYPASQAPIFSQTNPQYQLPLTQSQTIYSYQAPINSQTQYYYQTQINTGLQYQYQSQYYNLQPLNSIRTVQTQILAPNTDSQSLLRKTNSLVLQSASILNSGASQNFNYDNPLTYSTLENIIPRLDELDIKNINKDFDFNKHYELEFKKEPNIFFERSQSIFETKETIGFILLFSKISQIN